MKEGYMKTTFLFARKQELCLFNHSKGRDLKISIVMVGIAQACCLPQNIMEL